jgi:MraZ protein
MAPLTALHGSTEVTLNDGMLRLPDRFKAPFAAGTVVTAWLDGCVALWPRASWDALAARVVQLPIADSDARAFGRLLFASALEVEPGVRSIRLGEPHRRSGGFDEDGAVLVGAGDHAEVWSRRRWLELEDRSLDDVAGALAG